jgi:hypothetical protein
MWEVWEEIYEEAKEQAPEDPWTLYNIWCSDLQFAKDHKAKNRGRKDRSFDDDEYVVRL